MTTASRLKSFQDKWLTLRARYLWLRRLEKWGVSIASLVLGVFTLVVFRKGIEYFPVYVGYLLLIWLAGVALAQLRISLASRGPKLIAQVVDYPGKQLTHGRALF